MSLNLFTDKDDFAFSEGAGSRTPPRISVAVYPSPLENRLGTVPLRLPYPPRHEGTRLTLWLQSVTGSPNRRVRLQTRWEGKGASRSWAHWQWTARAIPQSPERGVVEAEAAQDEIEANGDLCLFVRGGETREATLCFDVTLAKGLDLTDYLLFIEASDITQGLMLTQKDFTVRLMPPPSRLLEHLPGLFREPAPFSPPGDSPGTQAAHSTWNAEKIPFFFRFLRGFDDASEPLSEAMERLFLLFGVDTTPAEFLPWLATWVGLTLNAEWSEIKQRELLRSALELWRWRGTKRGMIKYVEIFAGVTPVIKDQPVKPYYFGAASFGTAHLGDLKAHTFRVSVPLLNPTEAQERVLRTIIESQKPAHTHYELHFGV